MTYEQIVLNVLFSLLVVLAFLAIIWISFMIYMAIQVGRMFKKINMVMVEVENVVYDIKGIGSQIQFWAAKVMELIFKKERR